MIQLLSSSAFLIVNKNLARQFGLKATIYLADLVSKRQYFINNGSTDEWFFNTENNIEADTTLNSYHQRKCIKILKKNNLIEVKRKGIPAKQYFKINEEQVLQILNNLSNKNSITINKNKTIKTNNKYFKKPTKIEIEVYCLERNNIIDAEAFLDFYESKDWMIGKNKMKDWKAAVRTWERRSQNKSTKMSKLDSQISAWQEAKKLL